LVIVVAVNIMYTEELSGSYILSITGFKILPNCIDNWQSVLLTEEERSKVINQSFELINISKHVQADSPLGCFTLRIQDLPFCVVMIQKILTSPVFDKPSISLTSFLVQVIVGQALGGDNFNLIAL